MFDRIQTINTLWCLLDNNTQGCEVVQLWHALQGVWTYVKSGAPAYAAVTGVRLDFCMHEAGIKVGCP